MARNKKTNNNMYKAKAIHVKNDTSLASLLDAWTHSATHLYNSATFLNRNTVTGLALPEKERHPNQQHAINEIQNVFGTLKKTRWKTTLKKLDKIAKEITNALHEGDEELADKKRREGSEKRKTIREVIEQKNILNQHHRRANYNELDAYYKYTNDENYRALPIHAAQNILKEVNQAWDNWSEQLYDWRNGNSLGLTGKPGIPSYKNKKTRSEITLPAADIVIVTEEKIDKDGKPHKKTYAQLPLIRSEERIEITNIVPSDMKLVTVQINPVSGGYDVTFVYKKKKKPALSKAQNLAGGDLGLDNLLTIVVNDGVTRPLIIDGKELKSINQYWNKKIAHMRSELPHGIYKSKAIDAAWAKRRAQLHERMNQAANIAIAFLLDHDVREFVVGKNDGWKEDFGGKVPTKRKNKQDFMFMPYDYLLKRISHKCEEVGILFTSREESYTSKASLVDGDYIPTYGVTPAPREGFEFSGSRKSRGCYQSKETMIGKRGLILNADVNGAGNILRKEYGDAFGAVKDWRFLMSPKRVRLKAIGTGQEKVRVDEAK